MRHFVLLLLLSLSACGYAVPGKEGGWVGGEARIVYVELFDNQTSQPYLENYLTEALVLELSRSRLIELTEDPARADVRLAGSVTQFTSEALSYGATDRITDYRATMQVSARLVSREEEKVLWQQRMQRTGDYLAAVSKGLQLDEENLTARQISSRIAEDLYASLLNNF